MQNNSNKNWENQGWDAMQQMLNEELPVKEKEPRRRIALWYWAAGVAVLVGVTFFNLTRFDSNLISDENSKVNLEISSTDLQAIVDIQKNLKEGEDSHKTAEPAYINEEVSVYNEKQSTPSAKTSIQVSKVIASSEPVIQPKEAAGDFTEKINESKTFVQNEKTAALAGLPMLSADLDLSKIELLALPKPNSKKVNKVERRKKKLKLIYGLSAGITSGVTFNANGAQVGMFVDLPVKKSNFALQTGLNYRLSRQKEIRQNWTWGTQGENDIGFIRNDPNGSVTVNQLEGISTDYYYNERTNQIESSQYFNYHILSIPLSLNYKLNPKWNFSLGTEGAVLLNFLKNNPSAQLSERFFDQSVPAATGNLTTFNLKNFDLGGTAAVNFKPSKHFQLNLKYHHGNLIQGDNWQTDNRFLSAGGSYIF